ncbi:MAG TPA: class I adenylate-forming enzyme family protein [Clostridia bacterium]|nr:class I adenylate-forming enzyme family protein [Clostridia bacterium]
MKGLYGLIEESAAKYPDKLFVQSQERAWTYHEVECIARAVSAYLLECGVSRGDRVVIFCDNSVQYIAAFYGILRINAVAVPVNPVKMAENVLFIVEKCSPKLILACDSTAEKLESTGGWISKRIVNIDRDICEGACSFGATDEGRETDVDENDTAMILFTSGTTANPKGVMLTHRNLMANTEAIVDYLGLDCEDSVLMTLPFTYSYGNSVLLTHTYAGASIIIESSAVFPLKVLEAIKKYRVSGFSTVGSYINLMLKYIRNSGGDQDFPYGLRYITLAGEAANKDDIACIARNYPSVELFIMYGQTEAGARLSYLSPGLLGNKQGSIGRGLCNVELRVLNENGREVKPGEVGEIVARGPNIMKGYWEDAAATDEVLKDGWLYTGDNATVDEDGFIYIKGRKSDIIKHMGHRISPVEIENEINSCKWVKESAVVESAVNGLPAIKAFIVTEKAYPLEEIIRYVCPKLPPYMRPNVFEVIDQIPRTESGKIRRSVLRRNQCAE